MARILYVEDDESLSFLTRDQMQVHGLDVDHCADGASALEMFKSNEYDLCVLDVMLPEVDGFSIAKEIRLRNPDIPILFLTAKSLKEDRIEGLKLGADDYITKPYSMEELLLRIEVFLRRRNVVGMNKDSEFQFGHTIFDHKNLHLKVKDQEHTLTQREADLLKLFMSTPDEVLKRSDILLRVWGEDDYFLGRSLDVFISRLRKYLSEDDNLRIENVHGVGFRLRTD